MRRVSERETEWLRNHYSEGTIKDTLDAFEQEFGWRPSKMTIYNRAHKLGVRKQLQDPRIRNDRAQVRIRWSNEPEMEAWMLEHDDGSFEDTIEGFEREFGIRLSRGQINLFRANHGTQKRDIGQPRRGGRHRKPVGSERHTKGGILVKVAEEATVPLSKDNWRFKHHIAYEAAYGPIPEGCNIWAVDGDTTNCDPENLMAVPRRVSSAVNALVESGMRWHDRASMEAVVKMAQLRVGINDAEHRATHTCEVCGARFRESQEQRRYGYRVRTCPTCRSLGKKARGKGKARKGPQIKRCKVCGAEFEPSTSRQVRCRRCIDEKPKHTAERQRSQR